MDRRIIIGCVIVIALTVCCTAIGGVLLLRTLNFEEPTDMTIQVVVPEIVPQGEPFAIDIQITNLFTDVQILDSIDFSTSYLEGFSVQESSPPFTDDYVVPAVDFHSYTFEHNLEPTVPVDVEFVMVPEVEGAFVGVIDVCINSGASCQTFEIETAVGDAAGR